MLPWLGPSADTLSNDHAILPHRRERGNALPREAQPRAIRGAADGQL
jgi:hypothetical protein